MIVVARLRRTEPSPDVLVERRREIDRFIGLRRVFEDVPGNSRLVRLFEEAMAGAEHADDGTYVLAAEIVLEQLGQLDSFERFFAEAQRQKASWRTNGFA